MAVISPPLRRRWWPAMPDTGVLTGKLRRLGKLELVAITAFVLLTVFLIFVPLIVPFGETESVGRSLTGVSGSHWFGIDEQSRDVFSRTLLAMRTSWFS